MRYGSLVVAMLVVLGDVSSAADRPNVIIVVADDMGWRDTGYRGNPIVKTPNLDDMAGKGVCFDQFYAAQQMCSPGRFAIMTGRTPFRTGLHHLGAMRPQEITVARALKQAGYHTAQFGKWHLGATATSPAKMGFDKAIWTINFYDLGASLQVGDTSEKIALKGDTSVAAMELALQWIREKAKAPEPFFAYVCFGSPHSPHRATEEFKALYKDQPEKMQHYWGEVSGLDAAVGNLRAELRKLNIADNTMLWFTSDNGGITPQSQDPSGKGKGSIGSRTQGLLEWPARIKQPLKTDVVVCHMDLYPTILDVVGVKVANQPPLDGISLAPLLEGKMSQRPKPIGFMLWNGQKKGAFEKLDFVAETQGVWIDGPYRLVIGGAGKKDKPDDPSRPQLFDVHADPARKTDLAVKMPDVVKKMHAALDEWRKDVRASFDGRDFSEKK